jgi:hypothetical protein
MEYWNNGMLRMRLFPNVPLFHFSIIPVYYFDRYSLKLFDTTVTLLMDMASAAKIG